MFKKTLHITLFFSAFGFLLLLSILLLVTDVTFFKVLLISSLIGIILFFTSQILLDKFIFGRMNLLFDKILNITYERKVLNLLEDPFDLIDSKVNIYLEKQEKEEETLNEQQKFRREYIGNIAHELKTPIFTAQGYILTLLDGGLEDERINRDYLKRADKSIERIIDLLDDLDLITKLDSGEFPLEIETFDLVQLCNEVIDSLELKGKERDIKIGYLRVPKRQVFVDADRNRIFQVLSNLIVNAIKYGRDGGSVDISFNIMSEQYVLVEVIDDGLGIDEDNLLKIFQRFYRVDKSGGRKFGGSGLGLSIVKHILEAHEQTLNVNSKVGVGSTFSFTLKLA
ncbi:MAG: two-component sensor histidine kinase [Flavobacteriales bacterium]|nr:two-component sensor histidine kinase [Flavobacteriales bacterium]|tara:strand:- start:2447 stop:3466 length:1020 start_codon:yes stop_codon:yes gene_type:complete